MLKSPRGADGKMGKVMESYLLDEKIAERSMGETDSSDLWPRPVVTEISELDRFYEAEEYHQNYYRQNPDQPYCFMVVDPKVKKFREMYQVMLNPADR